MMTTDPTPTGEIAPVTALERARQRWSATPIVVRVLLVVGIVVGLGIVGEIVGNRVFGWYTRRLSAIDPLEAAYDRI